MLTKGCGNWILLLFLLLSRTSGQMWRSGVGWGGGSYRKHFWLFSVCDRGKANKHQSLINILNHFSLDGVIGRHFSFCQKCFRLMLAEQALGVQKKIINQPSWYSYGEVSALENINKVELTIWTGIGAWLFIWWEFCTVRTGKKNYIVRIFLHSWHQILFCWKSWQCQVTLLLKQRWSRKAREEMCMLKYHHFHQGSCCSPSSRICSWKVCAKSVTSHWAC